MPFLRTSLSVKRGGFYIGYVSFALLVFERFVLIDVLLPIFPGALNGAAVIDAMRWHGDCDTVFHVINRSNGRKATKDVYRAESFFFLHTINAYEEGGNIVIDIALYKNPHMLHCMTLAALQTAQSDPSYAFR